MESKKEPEVKQVQVKPVEPEPEVKESIACPHCQGEVTILEIKCAIFRHAIYRATGQPINPHMPKAECDRLTRENLIWGCGKPFRYNKNTKQAEICDYI